MKLIPEGLRKLFAPVPMPDLATADRAGAELRQAAQRAIAAARRDGCAATIEEVLENMEKKRGGARAP